jgi:hypothetical protein
MIPTLEMLRAEIRKQGFTNAFAADWEDEYSIYAFSVECHGIHTLGHTKCTAHYSKSTGWLTVDGQAPRRVS